MDRTWIVVGDASRARIFETDSVTDELEEVGNLVHPASRLHRRDIDSDAPGRSYHSTTSERHAFSLGRDPKEQTAIDFAKEVAAHLEKGRLEARFQHLVLVAPPAFLGRLRAEFKHPLADCVTREIAKELSHLKTHELHLHLPAHS